MVEKRNKWRLSRAGLLNFWYYDEEIFHFSNGKLLLRGANGSGKSVTMQSLIPVLLDGKKSPDRLDPFGSKARKMEDYLLGEKDVSQLDERTGYLFLEYVKEETNQYLTTGMGMQAKKDKGVQSWYFVITDNRRIGIDFFLYEKESHAGKEQKIPLSRTQLQNRIGGGGYVVQSQGDYMDLVNKYIFGFEDLEAFEDLVKLLIQLRSPKLSKEYRPSVIHEILEEALPPLSDEDLRHLSETVENMDQAKQQIEQLEREREALSKLIRRYDVYNRYRLAEKAHEYLQWQKRRSKEEKKLQEKEREKGALEGMIRQLTERERELRQQLAVLEQKQERLAGHRVWNLEKEKREEEERLRELTGEYNKKDGQRDEKRKAEWKQKETVGRLEKELADLKRRMEDHLQEMESLAEEASFRQHAANAGEFQRKWEREFDFSLWEKEAETHYQELENIGGLLRNYEQLKEKIQEYQKRIGEINREIDGLRREEEEWRKLFENDKQRKIEEIFSWAKDHPFLQVPEEVLRQAARWTDQLYEPYHYEAVRQLFFEVFQNYQLKMNEKIAKVNNHLQSLQENIRLKEAELEAWKGKRDPEPPGRSDATREARKWLAENHYPFIPFYEAVEFRDHVPKEVRNRLEAALLDAGILDALITERNTPIRHDRVLVPAPKMLAHTLADYLKPDVPEDSPVSRETVDEILLSILVDDRSEAAVPFAVREDGSYEIGLLKGHAVPVDSVRFIGKTARKRFREEQILRLTEEIAALQREIGDWEGTLKSYQEEISAAKEAMAAFPGDADLQESFRQIKNIRADIEWREKERSRTDGQMQASLSEFQQIKREIDRAARDFNIEKSLAAYDEAKRSMRSYEQILHQFRQAYTNYRVKSDHLAAAKEWHDTLIREIDELTGELYAIKDKMEICRTNVAEIEKQLRLAGVEEIRKQIREVQGDLAECKRELETVRDTLPRKQAESDRVASEIQEWKNKLDFTRHMIEAWKEAFSREWQYQFVPAPDELSDWDERAKWVMEHFGRLLQEKDSQSVDSQLSQIFNEQYTNLIEYRMTDIPAELPPFPWMDGDYPEEQQAVIKFWKEKSIRRIIQLDYFGKQVSPYYVKEMIENELERQKSIWNEQDEKLYKEILYGSIGNKLRVRIQRAQEWTKKMDHLMQSRDSSSGISFSIRWKPKTAETEEELDTEELVRLLQLDPRLLKETDFQKVVEHFRSKINRAKETAEGKGAGNTLLEELKGVLDYRRWFSFTLYYQRKGEPKKELKDRAFYKFSGGEKAMAMYIPLFSAIYSRYLEAAPDAPRIIALDEAFAGVDEENINLMFGIVEELGFDYIMNSQVLWGDYESVKELSIYELVRPKNQNFVTLIRYHWDGNHRRLITEDEEDLEDDSRSPAQGRPSGDEEEEVLEKA